MIRAVASAALLLVLAACHNAEEDAPHDRLIAPGIYSSVTAGPAGKLAGREIRLAQGSSSATVEVTACDGAICAPVRTFPVQHGRGGISFVVPAEHGREGHSAVVALTPVPDGVMLTELIDSEAAPQDSILLRPRPTELGLAAAR